MIENKTVFYIHVVENSVFCTCLNFCTNFYVSYLYNIWNILKYCLYLNSVLHYWKEGNLINYIYHYNGNTVVWVLFDEYLPHVVSLVPDKCIVYIRNYIEDFFENETSLWK